MTTLLLAIIALCEITRLVLTHKKSSKRKHFQQKLEGVQKMIWDLEFKSFKTREIREDIRKEYDTAKSRIDSFIKQIETWTGDEAERKGVEDKKVRCERDVIRFEAQMKQLDEEVNGAKPSAENHDGVNGIVQQIDSLRELVEMLKDHIKSI